jgi:uncharacterized protein YggT (Ycf19 family)
VSAPALPLAISRIDVADYVSALFLVYTILIFIYVVTSLIFAFGVRMPYARWSSTLLEFLRDVCEPYLRIWRRILPMFGPLDLSPIVGVLVLQLVGSLISNAIAG